MDGGEVDRLVKQLSAGFDALQEEYARLHAQHRALEKKLATARDQYNELAKTYAPATPPLSLASSSPARQTDPSPPNNVADLLTSSANRQTQAAANKVRTAIAAATNLQQTLDATQHSVKIWSGPSADRPSGTSSMMPSISESPFEQDFTIAGKPSMLGCPFASMAKKKLSSHAASVLSRYNSNGSNAASADASPSNTSRINGRESLARRQGSRRESLHDPIKAEICGLSDHSAAHPAPSPQDADAHATVDIETPAEPGVCPIRFLDQHSPEEVATYFEKHKHELPRSHEICVKRYQSNEAQIRQLDAKYGSLVSMIAGLGETHKGMLPVDHPDAESEEKVRRWASSVAAEGSRGEEEEEVGAVEGDGVLDAEEEERLSHFARPLREIRVGESPSRPWGISVPAKYLEQADADADVRSANGEGSRASSRPAPRRAMPQQQQRDTAASASLPPHPLAAAMPAAGGAAKCPFGHGAAANPPLPAAKRSDPSPAREAAAASHEKAAPPAHPLPPQTQKQKFPDRAAAAAAPHVSSDAAAAAGPRMVFTGPVFIGLSAEEVGRVLGQWGGKH